MAKKKPEDKPKSVVLEVQSLRHITILKRQEAKDGEKHT